MKIYHAYYGHYVPFGDDWEYDTLYIGENYDAAVQSFRDQNITTGRIDTWQNGKEINSEIYERVNDLPSA